MKHYFIAFFLLLASCGHIVKSSSLTQPNPLYDDSVGWDQTIITHDMELPSRFYLQQKVWFVVVSKDRIRFHFRLMHKWKEYADLRQWSIVLTDDKGNKYYPEIQQRNNKNQSTTWDHEMRTAQRNEFGDVVRLNNDAYKMPVAMDSVNAFVGTGDCVFTGQDLFTRGTKQLQLTMTRGSITYVFEWNFWMPSEQSDD